ncbi:MAG TPA: GDYXXLXY domain-containing protein [Ramlibacter sp.]|uniref:GDYXXLXY domain-containing protein n=1 Tax=Ramlibacter sp. TaxID=1917967 RepID=UPI002C8D31C2|nr:GDYXXLXY domain-containing protein [Ramlibacter sp.]HVZ44319.1 GDYXXLXY domain-containing protein [Ramlibacter sp.]
MSEASAQPSRVRETYETYERAVREGLLPAGVPPVEQETRPWPVLLLTALGAWLAAIPLLLVVGMLLGDLLRHNAGLDLVGLLLLGGAFVVLRGRGVPVFVEQLALIALVVGAGSLAAGLDRDLGSRGAAAVLMAIALGFAWAIPRPWLRNLLGVAGGALAIFVVVPHERGRFPLLGGFWFALHLALGAWLAALAVQARWRDAKGARHAAALEPIAAGWLLATLAGLAWWAGMTFLLGGVLGGAGSLLQGGGSQSLIQASVLRAGSALAAAGGAYAIWRAWPALRQPLALAVYAVLVLLSAFMPTLGAVLLALAVTATSRRWRLAAASAFAAAWIVGAFYYRLDWTLATKGLVMFAAGTLLAAAAWLARDRVAVSTPTTRETFDRRAALLVGLGAVATLAFANYAIRRNESLIAEGGKVFVRLAPVDPRSLMQGDYMRLDFQLPASVETQVQGLVALERPFVVVKLDERRVAQPLRIVRNVETVAPDEMPIELTPKGGRWTLVSDAWFFREGDGKRWQAARYAEFRVLPDGRALLVGLADENLQPIAIR